MTAETGLRSWLARVEELGELTRIEGADWDREMATISEIVEREQKRDSDALLFSSIPDYSDGHRTLFNHLGSEGRLATALDLPPEQDDLLAFSDACYDAVTDTDPVPTETVSDGPLLANRLTGADVDLTALPVPRYHASDGGRFIGTADCVVTRDPDSGWVNVGTYRAQLRSETEVFVSMEEGKHGRLHQDKHFDRGEPMPIAATFGQHPAAFISAANETDKGVNEFEFAGGLRGEPFAVLEGPVTGLPLPAHAEIAIEGYLHPDDYDTEGPFGEWMGYYGGGTQQAPYITVEAVYFREDPILTCTFGHKPPHEQAMFRSVVRSALLKRSIEDAGVPNVEGVWGHEAGNSRQFTVVSIEQDYPGHARQAAIVASQIRAGVHANRWTVVVDEDIDPSNIDSVLWAMCTRCDPARDVETHDRTHGSPVDPMVPEGEAAFDSRTIVDATIPYERLGEFAEVAVADPDYAADVREKWAEELGL